jgi:hypothetical protein
MKNIKNYFELKLALAVSILFATIGVAQPVIQVPATCNVVVAGTGATAATGLGGRVGNGGIVTMADPFDNAGAAGDFTYITNGTVLIGWTLYGDLSVQTANVPPAAGVYGSGATTPLNIESYNRRFRPAEGPTPLLPTSNSKWGRSKGRVRVSYSAPPCNNFIEFEIFKTYNLTPPSVVPPIIGPDCVEPNKTYTYSVDQIASDNADDAIGFDKYYWSGIPGGALNIYNSADKSSITFTTGGSVTAFTLQCCYGRANVWDGDAGGANTTCVNKAVKIVPVAPTITPTLSQIPASNCVATGTASTSYSFPVVAGETYLWTSTNGAWILSQSLSAGNWVLGINFNTDNNPGRLTLKITSACNPVEFNYQINRTLAPGLGIVGTPANACLTAPANYSLPTSAIGNYTTWSITPIVANGPTVTNGVAPNSSTTVTPGTASGAFSLIATSHSSTACTSTNTSIAFNIPPAAPVFTGTSPTCVPKSTTLITSISVTPVAASGYVWDLTSAPGWSITANSTSSNPTFTSGSSGASVILKVKRTGTGGCDSAQASLNITYLVVNTFPSAGGFDQYILSCGTASSWTINGLAAVPSGNVIIAGNVLLIGGPGPAPTAVCANTTFNGSPIVICATSFGSHGLKQSNPNPSSSTKDAIQGVKIFPNPNDGNFTIQVDAATQNASATLIDNTGKEIANYTLHQGENSIQNAGVAKGSYFVILKVDGQQEARQIMIK